MTGTATGDAPPPVGLLVIDKAEGFTSMDVCAIVRGKLRGGGAPKRIKVGHGGTLDPLATGVLVVLIGKATRMCDRIMAGEKGYEAVVDLEHRSATDDREGPLIFVPVSAPPTRIAVEEACSRFVGVIQQTPPAFSAMHIGGRRAYDLARSGKEVKLAPRPVTIGEIRVLAYQWPLLTIDVRCGKGTYIRSLARDLGGVLGTGGTLHALRRTRVGAFGLSDARTIASLPQVLVQADLMPPPEMA